MTERAGRSCDALRILISWGRLCGERGDPAGAALRFTQARPRITDQLLPVARSGLLRHIDEATGNRGAWAMSLNQQLEDFMDRRSPQTLKCAAPAARAARWPSLGMSLALALALAGAGGCATSPAEPAQPMDFMMYHTRVGPSRSASDEARLAAKSALAAAETAVQERRFTPAAAAYLDAARAYLETSNRVGARASEKDAQRLRENRLILYTNAALCLLNERQKADPERIGDTRKLLTDTAAADPELAETLRTMAAELPRPPSYLRSGPR